MKKIWIAAVSLLLCAAMIIFAGCSGLEKGKIDGNYKEPTQEELQSTLASLEGKSMIGDPQEEGWEFGFNAGGNFEETIDLNGKQFTLKASVSYSLNLVKGEQAVVPEGKGDLSQPLKLFYMARICTAGAAESSFTSAFKIQVTEILII